MFSGSCTTSVFSSSIFNNIAMILHITELSIHSAMSTKHLMALWPIWYHYHPKQTSSFAHPDLGPVCLVKDPRMMLLWTPRIFGCYCIQRFALLQMHAKFLCDSPWLQYSPAQQNPLSSEKMPMPWLYVANIVMVYIFLLCGLPFGTYCFLLCWHNFSSSLFSVFSYSCPVLCQQLWQPHFLLAPLGQWCQQWALNLVLQMTLQDSTEMVNKETVMLRKLWRYQVARQTGW